jgi:hypothetical protein
MAGDGRVRFCPQCRQNVYNLTAMSPHDAEALVRSQEGGMCARLYRRADGAVTARDCPAGLAAARRLWYWFAGAAAVLLAAVVGVSAAVLASRGRDDDAGGAPRGRGPFGDFLGWFRPPEENPPMIMGEICPPPAPVPGGGPEIQ